MFYFESISTMSLYFNATFCLLSFKKVHNKICSSFHWFIYIMCILFWTMKIILGSLVVRKSKVALPIYVYSESISSISSLFSCTFFCPLPFKDHNKICSSFHWFIQIMCVYINVNYYFWKRIPFSLFSTSITNIIHYMNLPSHCWQLEINIIFLKMKIKNIFHKDGAYDFHIWFEFINMLRGCMYMIFRK